ncbi:MAG: bifunctional 4-hydroxy-2-oxoglutarate aldolase/2-dehydro-3-deoxy-phosphogluconate aldolase [Oscillospiraceae bacterium]|nr:bifunctional 4-hydroxy-2-oxoglutarate aldolase/2-dehydro-3-deoxy-phosphogluconate aldolase [Oscillospiraceae bacterium]
MARKKLGAIYSKIKNYGIVPVIKIDEADNAVPLAEALALGGLNIAEITFRTECAAEAIKKIAGAFPDMLLAAGNVLTLEQVKSAVDSGAKIIVSPGLNENVVFYCVKNNIPVIPECANAGDIEKALSAGIDIVKFFPAEESGGLDMLKALSEPYPNVRFIPTGGITENNLVDYLMHKSVLACGGSFMVKEEYIKNGEFDKIRDITVCIVQKMLGFDLAHLVINCENAEQAERDAGKIESIFGFEKKDSGASVSNADILHFMKNRSYGRDGQIAICSNFIERAVFYLKEAKKEFIDESARFDADGRLTSIYLDNIISGFAIKLVRK